MAEEKVLYLVSGPIGAGKSTYAKSLINYFGLSSLEYISADIYFLLYFKDSSSSEGEAYSKAKQYSYYKLDKAISQGRSFIWETVVAKDKKLNLIESILEQGYILKCLYVGMRDYDISINRVFQRHELGWYTVPEQKTIDRHQKSISHLKKLIMLADSMMIIDSSSDQGKIVMWKKAKTILYRDAGCDWLPNPI